MKYVRRLIWYAASRLLIVCCILGLMVTAFYFSMNASNIYIILKDGMAKRAQVVMMAEDENELDNYFSANYLERDEALKVTREGNSPYQKYYTVTGFDHRLNMTWMWCWPWESTARAEFIERVPRIDGRVNRAYTDTAKQLFGEDYETPPKWQAGRYTATLVKENSQWHIKNIQLKEALASESGTP